MRIHMGSQIKVTSKKKNQNLASAAHYLNTVHVFNKS